MIRVYPSRLEGEPIETHEISAPTTLREWLTENAPRLDLTDPPITIHINGQSAWLDDSVSPGDVVDIHVEPRGPFIIGVIVAAVAAVALMLLMPKPAMPRAMTRGRGLDTAALDANMARVGEPIPEIFGRPPRIYPDYITATRSFYTEPLTNAIDALLCIGKGRYEKSIENVYIGDTQAINLGSDVEIRFFEPGESLAGVPQADWWHTPQEVGFTNRGGAGLEIGIRTTVPTFSPQAGFKVDGRILSTRSYTDDSQEPPVLITPQFPTQWNDTVTLNVEVPFPATVTSADTITSAYAMAHFTPQVGDILAVSGTDDDGDYEVVAYAPASAGLPPDPGTPSSVTGSDAPDLNYGSVRTITVTRGSDTFTVNIDASYSSVAQMAAAIASQLNGTGITAQDDGSGHIRIIEQAPHTGLAIIVSGQVDDVLGASPVSVTGTAAQPATPAHDATIQLAGAQFTPGNYKIAIGPAGHKYQITAVSNATTRQLGAAVVTGFVGWPASSDPDIFVRLDPDSQETNWTGPFTATPPCALANAFEIDYTFPNGLIQYSSKGHPRALSATVYMQWREVGTSSWNSVTYRHSLAQPNGIGFTRRINLPRLMAVEVRLRRSPKHDTTRTRIEDVQWTGLRSRLPGAPMSYPGVTLMAVRLKSGNRMSSQSDNKVWLRGVTRILPTVENPAVMEPTCDIMPAVLHMLDSVGYGRDRVDMVAAQELHDIWVERGDKWDYAVKDSTTLKTLANHCLKAGFAELTIDRGLVKPVRDALRDGPNYIYSPQEFIDYPTMTTRMLEPDEVDGVDAEYVDSGTGRVETVQYRLPGDLGRRVQKISLIGITDPVRAWRLAARHRRTLAYRRTTFKGETELQALNSSYMSYDRIQDGIPGYGQSAFVVSVRGQALKLSEAFDWNQSGALVLAFRQMDGRLTRPYGVARGVDDYHAILDVPIPVPIHLGGDGRDPTMVYFGKINNWSHGVLVTSISPGRNGRVKLEAVEYDQRVYVEDDRDPRGVTFLTTDVYPTPDVWHYLSMRPDSIEVDIGLIRGSHKTKDEIFMKDESIDVGIALISGRHQDTTTHELEAVPGGEAIDVGIALISGDSQSAIEYENPSESIDVNISLIEGSHEQG